jgi:hypothetical protein
VATKANQTKVVELKNNMIGLGIDPKDLTVMGYLVKKKDIEIKVLRKRLNRPKVQQVQTREFQANHEDK